MADLARIKRNVAKMASQNAPIEDIDGYIASEGVSLDDVRNFKAPAQPEAVTTPKTDRLPQEQMKDSGQASYLDAMTTWLEGAASGIPIAGPFIQKGSDFLATEIGGRLTGQNPAQMRDELAQRRAARESQYPASALSGNLAGAIGATGAVGSTAVGARGLGIVGESLLGKSGASAVSSMAIGAADTAARGGDAFDVAQNGLISGAIGGAIPVVGAGVRAGLGAAADRAAPIVNSIRFPEEEAQRRLGSAFLRDRQAAPQNMLSPFDERVSQITGVPLINADRGGETTRALARSVANQSPEARAIIEKTASDRFGAQSQRATDFVKLITGGAVDDIGYQQAIKDAARYVNKPRYEKAFDSSSAQQMFSPELQELMQSPAIQRAARMATARSANRGAVEGFKAVENPFHQAPDGAFKLRQKADGTLIAPTLRFWDQVKRNLDSDIGKAQRAGDNTLFADLTALKNKLVANLDEAVPEYRAARQGAASYFDAEDAIEAGKKFATSPRSIPEARRAFEKFSPPEKAAFQTGFASELIDRIKASGDRTNVINQVFKSQAAREQMELVFGPQKLRQIEAYVRVEDIADRLRGALGNSTTARQLVELGIGAGSGFAVTGGDWKGALGGALVAKGARNLTQRADAKVMERVAELLTRDDPKAIQAAVRHATQSPAFMRALEQWSGLLAAPARGAALGASQ